MNINEIYQMDCLLGMNQFQQENGSIIDAIITDPPYNISMENHFKTMNRAGIDFGKWDHNFDIISWISPAVSLLKNGGSIIIFTDWKNLSYLKEELEKNNCLVKEVLMWKKDNPMPRNRDRLYVTSCEFAIWATKGKGWTFNRQRTNYENAIFEYPIVTGKKRLHPTQKPVELMRGLIKIHTNPDDLILDPFIGSGSTAVASLLEKRNFIGFELDEGFYQKAITRIKNCPE